MNKNAEKKRPVKPNKRWNETLAPYLPHVQKRGFVAEVVRQLEAGGCPTQRQQVDRWLHANPTKRTEPLAGMGMELVEAMDRAVHVMEGR